ncbi:response regulator [Natronococcus pandeyae]|uniref:Response regulator n=1 Tax=Natronococcus pandeyae TaxID=2055836 RepID=A0A8J8Q4T7_9EURY|nr:response regulator [Natronococcus pandeyae]TYL38443.1 response regulator [Natronococcus pandeyae]
MTASGDVVLVEDNPGDVRLVQEAFNESAGDHTLHVATTANDALELLNEQARDPDRSPPDLVLLDLNLPGKNGYDVLETIREDPMLRRLPVIVLTSSKASDDIRRCYRAQANAYLTKPIETSKLVSMVHAIEQFWFEHASLPPEPS